MEFPSALPEDVAAGGWGPGSDSGTEPRHRNAAGGSRSCLLDVVEWLDFVKKCPFS